MPTIIGIGLSSNPDAISAANEAAATARQQLQGLACDTCIVLMTPSHINTDSFSMIRSTLKPKELLGTSTGALICSTEIMEEGIAVICISSDELTFQTSVTKNLSSLNAFRTGFNLSKKHVADQKFGQRKAFLYFSDFRFNRNEELVSGLQENLGAFVPITGLLSSDKMNYEQSIQFYNDEILTQSLVSALICGTTPIALAQQHGLQPLGKPRVATKVDGHIIYEIDHKPAGELYEEYLDCKLDSVDDNLLNKAFSHYPLGAYSEQDSFYLIRQPLKISEDKSIHCQAVVPENSEIHIMIATEEALLNSAKLAALELKSNLGDLQPKLVFVIESMNRKQILGSKSFKEIQSIKDILGYTTPIVGCFSFGEISPLRSSYNFKTTYVHNNSLVLLAIA